MNSMGLITFKHKGDLRKTINFMEGAKRLSFRSILERYAQEGVRALASATPMDSGETAGAWGYEIKEFPGSFVIFWTNSHIVDGFKVAVGIQYGHATRTGGWVQGRDYINPAIQPIFDKIAEGAWREVERL